MKRKKITSLLLAGIMASSAIFSGGGVALTNAATVNSSADSTPGDPVTTEGSQACQVDASVASTFAVTVPKKITLDGGTKSGSYNVTCKGDIAGNESVSVVPDATFAMSQTGKANVQAAVTQEKTMFRGSDYTGDLGDAVKMGAAAGESTGTAIEGSIAAKDLSAGAWSGAFNFTIGLREVYEEVTLEPDNLSGYVNAETGEAIATSGDVVIPAVVKDSAGKKYQVTGITGYLSYMGNDRPLLNGNIISVVLPKGLKTIGNNAFINCGSLTSINIPDGVTSIGTNAFKNCSGLTSINIPDSVTEIGHQAFENCNGLTALNIPNSVTEINVGAFNDCSNLTSITVDAKNAVYDSRENCNAIIETKTNELIRGCKNTVIPNSVISIKYEAFGNCNGLTSITIPDDVTEIGGSAFKNCSGLTSVNISKNVTSIKDSTFYGCSSLTSVIIPDNVAEIEWGAFKDCSSLTSITIPDSVTKIGVDAFKNCSGLTSVDIPNSVTNILDAAFKDCSNLSSVMYKGQTYTSKTALTQALSDNNVTVGSNVFNYTALTD